MKFISLFAGIGGFDLGFERAGHQCVAQVEIDPKCRQTLAEHWPGVPRFDDVRSVGAHNLPECDVVVGGFPCQDLSVAGKRAGLSGQRSGLFYEMTRIAHELRPAFLIFENVPGLLTSNNGEDFAAVMDEIDRIGYSLDINILDAQFFGLAQRRRRLFGVCVETKTLLSMKTSLSDQTILQWMLEVLQFILEEAKDQSSIGRPVSPQRDLSNVIGLKKRMNSFGITTIEHWNGLLEKLSETLRLCLREQSDWDAHSKMLLGGDFTAADTKYLDGKLTENESRFGSIARLWSSIWDDLFPVKSEYTTSMELKPITDWKICICAEMSDIILSSIGQLKNYFPNYLSLDSFASMLNKEYMNYARQAVSWLFTSQSDVCNYHSYIARGVRRNDESARRDIAIERCVEILSLRDRLRRDSAPRQGARQNITGSLTSRSGRSCSSDEAGSGLLIADTLTANYANNRGCSAGNAAKPVYNVVVDRQLAAPLVARQAKGGFTDPVNDNIIAFSSQDYGNDATFDLSPTLHALNHDKSHINGGGQIAIIQHASIGRKNDAGPQGKGWRDDGKSWTLDSRSTSDVVADPLVGVRRLTPTECERLQGFPTEGKCVTMEICTDYPKNFVSVEILSHKSQKLAGDAVRNELSELARYAASNLRLNNQNDSKHALNSALILCGEDGVEIHSREKCYLSANFAANKNLFPQLTQNADFALLVAGLNSIAAQIIRTGKAELPVNAQNSTVLLNGKLRLSLSGDETTLLVSDAVNDSTTIKRLLKSITSSHFGISPNEQILTILFCSVLNAIGGYIPKEILFASSFKIEFISHFGWTFPHSDSVRYHQLGNAVAVPVAEWIGRRLQSVTNPTSKATSFCIS